MINHGYCLLRNIGGPAIFGERYFGSEIIDPAFRALSLPTYLQTIRAQLFGQSPDNLMLNYRTRQLLSLVHASPLVEYITALDPRITYRFDTDDWADAVFQPEIVHLSGDEDDQLTLAGTPTPPDVSGVCSLTYAINGYTPTTVQVIGFNPYAEKIVDLVAADGPYAPISLAGSGYSFQLRTNNPAQQWRVYIVNRPERDLSVIADSLASIGEAVLISLFGVTDEEPYKTFSNLWFNMRELPLRLGALVCAYIYRCEEVRQNVARS